MMFASIDKTGVNLHYGRKLIPKDNIKFFIKRSGKLISVMPEGDVVLYTIYCTRFSRLQVGTIDGYAIMKLDLPTSVFILNGNVRIWHAGIRQTGDNRDAVPPFNKLFAHIRSVKRFRPIMLADDENIHYLAPSPVLTTPSVLSIITMSILIFLDLMYWRSNMTFSLGRRSYPPVTWARPEIPGRTMVR